jgi:hypothetical protein
MAGTAAAPLGPTRGDASWRLGRAVPMEFGPRWMALVVAVLAVAGLSGRALYMDGAHHVIHSMFYRDWFPQPTPRRFFAIIWNTGLIRLGVKPGQIDLAALLYSFTALTELALPAAAIAWSRIRQPVKSLFAAFYFSAILILGNFAVAESLFAIALTTIFSVYTLDPESDPRGLRRLTAAILLAASYESIALSNLFLALCCWYESREGSTSSFMRWTLIGVLCLGPIFQGVWYWINPNPRAGIGVFVVIVAVGEFLLLLLIAAYFKLVENKPVLRQVALILAFAGPPCLLVLPAFLHMRSDLFRFGYPSRFYGMAAMGAIALLPVLANIRFARFPSKFMEWYGRRPANDLGLAMCLLFCGLTMVTALDTFSFRLQMQKYFSGLSGIVPLSQCDFCLRPERYGVADLGYPWTWEEYSMAYSMHVRNGRPVVILTQYPDFPFSRPQLEAFIAKMKAMP